eukprot:gene5521-11127_t
MGKKRERSYIDRSLTLSNSCRRPNFVVGVRAVSIVENKMGSPERHFTHKLVHDDHEFAVAFVMVNDICVIMSSEAITASCVHYPVVNNEISGKKKKGAHKVKAGDVIITAKLSNGDTRSIRSPIGGKLIEINESLITSPSLLQDQHIGAGYIAVIYPNTLLPKPDNNLDCDTTQTEVGQQSYECYAWKKGSCRFGDSCRFSHTIAMEIPKTT